MKYLYLILFTAAACAPEYNITHDEPTAGSVGKDALPIKQDVVATIPRKLQCATASETCSAMRSLINYRTNASWSWYNKCADDTWNGQASGGRNVVVYAWKTSEPEDKRFVYPSQSNYFPVTCYCATPTKLTCDTRP